MLWRPVADHWRAGEGGTAARPVLAAMVRALNAPGYRCAIPAPGRGQVEKLAAAGTALNEAVRWRYVRGQDAGAIGGVAADVEAAARRLGAAQPGSAERAGLCQGKCDRLVCLRLDPRLHVAVREAAAVNGMTLGGWVRDSVAAEVDEHQARRPAEETRAARTVVARIGGLLVQAANVAVDRGEVEAIAAADDALTAATERLRRWGSR